MNAEEFYGNKFVAKSYFDHARQKNGCPAASKGLAWINNFARSTGQSFKDKILVDLGCGPGTSIKILSELQLKKYYGFDNSQPMLDIAKEYLQGVNCELSNIDISKSKLPIENNSVDFVSICSVLCAIEDISFIFNEVTRILKSDGIILFNLILSTSVKTISFFDEDNMKTYIHSKMSFEKILIDKNILPIGLSSSYCDYVRDVYSEEILMLAKKR